MNRTSPRPAAVLFDLDGTLVDTAPDLIEATNRLRLAYERAPLPAAEVRAVVSEGGAALVALALDGHAGLDREAALEQLLAFYESGLAEHSRVFPGLVEVLAVLEARGLRWGVVTNKARRFAAPLLARLALRPGVLICADDLAARKPDPAPLLEAARRLRVEAGRCWYVGDHLRDMQAAAAAGMLPVAALYGYLAVDAQPQSWPAQRRFSDPAALADALRAACDAA